MFSPYLSRDTCTRKARTDARGLFEADRYRAEPVECRSEVRASLNADRLHEAAGHDELPLLEGDTVFSELVRQPGNRLGRVAQDRRACARTHERAILLQYHTDVAQVEVLQRSELAAQNHDASRCVVGDGILDGDLPVSVAAVYDFEGGHDALGGLDDFGHVDAGTREVFLQEKGLNNISCQNPPPL